MHRLPGVACVFCRSKEIANLDLGQAVAWQGQYRQEGPGLKQWIIVVFGMWSVCSEMISATAELHWEGVFLFSKWGLLSFLKL